MLRKPEIQYKNWIVELKQKIQQSQIKAAMRVNSALIELYWELGKEISEKEFENTYGSGFFNQLSQDLKKEFPEIRGFSSVNLRFMKQFYLFYFQYFTNLQQVVREFHNEEKENLQQPVRKSHSPNRQQVVDEYYQNLLLIPWGHHIQLFTKCKTTKEAFFYINKTIENGWSRAVLMNMMSAKLIESQGKAITNFSKTLPDYDSDLVKETA